jgi:hypothetical protein
MLNWTLGLIGMAIVATGCGGERLVNAPVQPESLEVDVEGSVEETSETAVAPVASTLDRAAAPSARLPVPNLIPPTTSDDRLPTVTVGRSEPFGAIADTPIVRSSASVAVAPAPPVAVAPAPVPPAQITTVPLPNQPLPILPSGSAPAEAPATVTVNPPAVSASPLSPTSAANAIEVSGIVHAGESVSAIVQVPGEPTSRYVTAGDYLAGGSVFVKRIEVAGDPVVILEQNGVEVIRSVGSSAVAGAL